MTTLVTAFFRLNDRTVDEQEMFSLFDRLAVSKLPIILFLDVRFSDQFGSHRYENVHVVWTAFDQLPLSRLHVGDTQLPKNRNPEKDTRDFLIVQNSKIELLEQASRYSADTHLAWIDFGVMKIVRNQDAFLERLRWLSPNPEKISAPGCWWHSPDDDNTVSWRFCGGFLVVPRQLVGELARENRRQLYLPEKIWNLTWEVNVWAAIERENPELFAWYKADHDDSIIGASEDRPLIEVVAGEETEKWIKSQLGNKGEAPASAVTATDYKYLELTDTPAQTRICLVMIVKNEARIIERCLESALPFIDTWCITDTGSQDSTEAVIEAFFEKHGVPGSLARAPFHNYAQARNASLENAREFTNVWDYALLVDADMMLAGNLDKSKLTAPAYKILQKNGDLNYFNTRLVKRDAKAEYVSVTHEYVSVEGVEPLEGLWIDDKDDGGNKPEKGERDIRLLNEGLIAEPNNARYMFYLAQTYRGMGRNQEALLWYQKRINQGGWDEEVWFSLYSIAHSYKALGEEANFIKACLEAYNYRPSRGEPVKLLARHYRETGKNEAALVFAELLSGIPYPGDELFVERDAYDYGALQEIAIAGFYAKQKHTRELGRAACALLTTHHVEWIRKEALKNYTYYAQSAKEAFGAETRQIHWHPEDEWAPMNPSVHIDSVGGRRALIRTVNYTVSDGQYPTKDGSGVIRTHNYLVGMDENWEPLEDRMVIEKSGTKYNGFPVEGFEDCRLWTAFGHYVVSATIRDRHDNPSGHCEMGIVDIDIHVPVNVCKIFMVRDYEHEKTQKNWMPIIGEPGKFLYLCDPTIVIETLVEGTREISRSQPAECLAELRGGSQLIPYSIDEKAGSGIRISQGWLCITHEVVWRPERVYLHRFVWFDENFNASRISDPFYFEHVGIEFCAGLARDGNKLVASYGVNDASAHFAFFGCESVNKALRAMVRKAQ